MLQRSHSALDGQPPLFALRINLIYAMLFTQAAALLPPAVFGGILGALSTDLPWKSRVAFASVSLFVFLLWCLLLPIIQRRWVRFEVYLSGIREIRWLGRPRE